MLGKFLNTKEIARALGCSTDYIRKLQRLGMPFHQLSPNSKKYFSLEEVNSWLENSGQHQGTEPLSRAK